MPAGLNRTDVGAMAVFFKLWCFFRRLTAHGNRLFLGEKRQCVLHLPEPVFGNAKKGLQFIAARHFIELGERGFHGHSFKAILPEQREAGRAWTVESADAGR